VDKRRKWREQEQRLVERWNAAEERHRSVHAEILRAQAGGDGASETLLAAARTAQAEREAVRRAVARLKVEYNSGRRY